LPHPENKASPSNQKVDRKREQGFIRRTISNKTPKTINEKENPGVTALERPMAK
jgi:hypothetical protein